MRYFGGLLLSSLLLSSLLLSSTALALSLGKVSAPLAERSSASIKAAEQAALTQLLVQLTGREAVNALPGVSNLLADPQRWLSQYAYGRAADGSATLVAHFDAQGLSRALLQAGAPVWSLSRPPLLLWVATSGGVLPASEGDTLMQAAAHRGLPLQLPANSNEVAAADIRGRFMQPLFAASQAYATDLLASAVIYQGNPMRARWWLYQKQNLLTQGEASAAELSALQTQLVNQLTNAIASRYAVVGGAAEGFALRIAGIDSVAAWERLNQYLLSLAGVSHVAAAAVKGKSASWQLAFSGSREQLARLLSVNRHLSNCASAPVLATSSTVAVAPEPLSFCWQP